MPFGLGTAEQAPVAGAQVPVLQSSVNELQSTAVPGWQASVPGLHVSLPLQALLSSQSASFAQPQPPELTVHPPGSLQLSVVHGMPSLHTRAGPPQVPFVHVSGVVQASPSLHVVPFVLFGFEQIPVPVAQVPGLWHWSGAGHTTGDPATQLPVWQLSLAVHALLSALQGEPFVLSGFVQMPPLQVPTSWHWSSAVQTVPTPPVQTPL